MTFSSTKNLEPLRRPPSVRVGTPTLAIAMAVAIGACANEARPIAAPSLSQPSVQTAPTQAPTERAAHNPTANLVVGETDIRDAQGAVVVPLPADRTLGVDAKFKRSGAHDLFVLPLGRALEALAHDQDPGRLVIDVAPTTPYRLLVEVLVTAGATGWGGFDLRVSGSPLRHVVTEVPRASGPLVAPAANDTSLRLAVLVVDDGVALKGRGGNVAPGCNDTGPGLTLPKREGVNDLASLATCVRKLKSEFPNERQVAVSASPRTSWLELFNVIDVVRGPHLEFFPEVKWALVR